jgi:hypothetical protein
MHEGERTENRLEKWGRHNSRELLSSVCCRDYASSHVVWCETKLVVVKHCRDSSRHVPRCCFRVHASRSSRPAAAASRSRSRSGAQLSRVFHIVLHEDAAACRAYIISINPIRIVFFPAMTRIPSPLAI